MRRRLVARIGSVGILVLLAGCGHGEAPASSAATRSSAAGGPTNDRGLVKVPTDSPQFKQLQIDAVRAAAVPSDEVVAPARVVINPNRTARVLLPVAGRITQVIAKLGDAVEQGQPLASIESPDADAAVIGYQQAQASARQAEATLAKAQADVDRVRDLYEHRAVAQKDLIAAQNDLATARAAVTTSLAAVDQATRKLRLFGLRPDEPQARILIRAPIGGKVLEINVAPGEYRTDTAAPLMTVADLTTIWMISEVPEPSIRLIHAGDRVAISLVAYPDETFSGRVARIADVLDPQTRTVKVYVEMANPDGRLRPEMFGSMRHAGAPRTLPVVPPSAIVQEFGRATVFVERSSGAFERRAVTLAARTGDVVPVLDGLAAGDRIIVDGAVLLKER